MNRRRRKNRRMKALFGVPTAQLWHNPGELREEQRMIRLMDSYIDLGIDYKIILT